MPELVYVAGPYSADTSWGIKKNILEAEKYSLLLLRKGYYVITPHKNTAGYEAYPEWDQEFWYGLSLEILKRCDAIAMIPGWEGSRGSTIEHERALEWGKRIIYL